MFDAYGLTGVADSAWWVVSGSQSVTEEEAVAAPDRLGAGKAVADC